MIKVCYNNENNMNKYAFWEKKMEKLKNSSYKYCFIPVLIMFLINTITYSGTKLLTDTTRYHYDISLPIDSELPFVPAFIVIYVLSYLQWVVGFGLIARQSKEVCYRVISSEIVAKIICFIIFIVLPTSFNRPEITDTGIFASLTKIIYALDTPTNLFPSVHCLESWILFRTAHEITQHKKWLVPAWLIFVLLVFASVLLVKQHLILDIPAAIIVSEIGLFVGKKFKTGRIFEKINYKFWKGE